MDQIVAESASRGSRDGWLQAAYEALLDSGVDSVKILPLAKRLGLSRTSFYWFFKDREALLAALVDKWQDKNTGNLIRKTEAYAETIVEAMFNVFDCWLNPDIFDSKFEFAVRSWALQSDALLAKVQQADQRRLEALKAMFMRFGVDESLADTHARTTYLVQIGYISMQTREDIGMRMRRIPQYVSIFTGQILQQKDLDRFFSRHGYKP